ncbi:unnamed protein product, partial [marine sediment metagenome]
DKRVSIADFLTHKDAATGVHGVGASTVCSETEADEKITAHIGDTEEFTSDPAADAAHLGKVIRVRAAAGNKTYVKICVQNDADGYEWIQIGICT